MIDQEGEGVLEEAEIEYRRAVFLRENEVGEEVRREWIERARLKRSKQTLTQESGKLYRSSDEQVCNLPRTLRP